ncbi:putative nuclease HARBI1 [Harmonia axyridis]|uniref:putative nuclease HARBI1 n=1 Tax=Harmonia axyridis TaxID=115357 RepID=UPI001E276034|nr:putative nuclease HARBI1 [Harmonia axyridis]
MPNQMSVRVAAVYLLWKKKRQQQRRKRLQGNPLISQRLLVGAFVTLFNQLRDDETKFFNYFRMSSRTFDELLAKLHDKLLRCSYRRLPISPAERLMVTLRFLATGNTFTDLQYSFRLGVTTISFIVNEVCSLIWDTLHDECLPTRSSEMWQEIANGFLHKANFPNCVGAIDGKHIRIINPKGGGSMFYNYKNFYSIVLLAMCDADYCFTYVNIGAHGKNSDSSIFKNSALFRNLETNTLNLPGPKPLPGTTDPVNHFIIGDGSFGISKHVMKPYVRSNMTHKEKIFNYRLSRARRYIESTFGIMSNKFRVFHTPMAVSVKVSTNIVKACCILHNFIRVRDGYRVEDSLTIEGMIDLQNDEPMNRSGNVSRDLFAQYFLTPIGRVPWQDTCIF